MIADMSIVASLFTLVLTGLCLRYLFTLCYNIFFHPLKDVDGPFPAKIFGNYLTLALLQGRRAQTLLRLHERYGPVVRVGPNEVSVADFSLYREIYSSKCSSKEESFYSAATFLGHENIFSMRNKAQHAARRKMQSQPYSQQAVLENESLIINVADRLVQRILMPHGSNKTSTGTEETTGGTATKTTTTDVYPLCGLFSLEVICKTAFNQDISQPSIDSGLQFLKAMDDSAKLLPIDAALPFLKRYGLGEYVPGLIGHTFRQFKSWEHRTRELFHDFRTDSKQDTTERYIATPLLLKDDAYLGRRLNEDEAVEEAMGLTFAGSGTTSTTLTYLLYNLAVPKNRHCQLQLRRELAACPVVTLQRLKDLPYLSAVIRETMRLNPTIISTLPRVLDVPLRVATRDPEIILPKGTVVGMQNYVHHRDPKVYHNPHDFHPERWTEADFTDDMEKAFTPYSLGPRNCIGQNLARAELLLATALIFKRLDLRLSSEMKDDEMDMEDRFNIAPRGRRLLLDVCKLRDTA